jgi:putative transposase
MNNQGIEIMPNEAFDPIRARVNIELGLFVKHGEEVYRIEQILDFETVIAVEVETGRSKPLRIGELRLFTPGETNSFHYDIAEIADEQWRIAEQRFAAIKPLLNQNPVGRREVTLRAKELNVDTATLYRWLKRYNAYGVISALIPQKRGWKEGEGRINRELDFLISEVILDYYLSRERPTIQKTVVEVERRCYVKGISPPSPSTIRSRIIRISEKDQLRGRGFKEKAKNKFMPVAGSFPNADYPLSVIQIDHTPADIILVDDISRKPIGRPWLTLAIDVFSRMVVGYYLSFDAPSETSVAMCVAHSILPKDDWLLLHNVDAKWPVWGIPRKIHVDNGSDFRSNNFKQSCLMYGINLEFRPVKQPHFGGHIERMLGTVMQEIHDLPGTTFSSIKDREGYDSEKHAALTKSEFEEWIVIFLCKIYHQRKHSSLGMSPIRKWEIGIFGNGEITGVGVPPRPADRLSILLDFLPSFERTIQAFGVTIDLMTYYAESLRPWINAVDPEKPDEKRKFVFRRDPRDICVLWFFDPTLKQYFKIPTSDLAMPSMSVWEYQLVKDYLKKEGSKNIDKNQIYRGLTEIRGIVEDAKVKTKKARRQLQRRKEHEKKISPAEPLTKLRPSSRPIENNQFSELLDGDIEAFGDIA